MTTVENAIVNEELVQALTPEAQLIISPFIRHRLQEDYAEVSDAEVRSQVVKLLRSYYTPVASNRENYILDEVNTELPKPQHLGSQFGRRLQTAFLSENPESGLEVFRSLSSHTDDQKVLLDSTDEQFDSVWHRVKDFLLERQKSISDVVEARFTTDSRNGHENRSAFQNNDIYQFKGRETSRSLALVLRRGLEISVDPNGILILEQAGREMEREGVPLTELVKNWPILSISGFTGSKLSLAVHDAIDHVSTFDLAEKSGLFSKFEQLFQSIGAPQRTDIFKREGEILASISFGSRYWERQPGFVPLIDTGFIVEHLSDLAEKNELRERHSRAIKIVQDLEPGTEDYDKLGFVFSNYLVTLHEQRRRYGQIKQRDLDSGQMLGELNPFSADFLCFLIELHHEINAADEERSKVITNVHTALEEYLQSVSQHKLDAGTPLVLRPSSLGTPERLSESDKSWLSRHPQFSTIKERVHHE